jgi:hypothetical protein
VKIVMTLMARDEADIVDEHIRYHLEAGIDFVIATDHRSVDGTSEILRTHERQGHLHLLRERSEAYEQGEWVTRMARLAAEEFGADWVVNSDADEFWLPRGGTFREVLASIPSRFDAIRGIWRHFALRPETPGPFFERMIVRRLPTVDVTSPYCANAKVIHRADRQIVVGPGNHDVFAERLVLLREWVPFEMLHFPIRSREHLERKYPARVKTARVSIGSLPSHVAAIAPALRANPDEVHRAFLVDDAALEVGLGNGELTIDTRLRDRLRGEVATGSPLPSLEDDAAFAEEVDAMLTLDSARRLTDRVESLERRLVTLETARARLRRRRRTPV